MNFRLTLQYDGTEFSGWQVQRAPGQAHVRTVQGELERVLSRLEGRSVAVHGAGRTDAGVHAEAQIASVRLAREMTEEKLRAALNGNLPRDVRVVEVEEVAEDFHARFSATGKTYRYRIFNARFASPFLARYALLETRPLDVERMREAARLFLGTHDWTAFSSAQTDVETRVRTVTQLDVRESWNESGRGRLVEIEASANGFLRYMVRSIAGTLLGVGRGEVGDERIRQAIATGDRRLAAKTAAPHGLTLVQVHYEKVESRKAEGES